MEPDMHLSLSKRFNRAPHPLLTGAAAGLLAGGTAWGIDHLLGRFVSSGNKRRAGPYFARKILAERLVAGKRRARIGLRPAYGVFWGLAYAAARRKAPWLKRLGGLPLAPLLGLSPPLRRTLWKELGNRLAWAAAAELVRRGVAARSNRRQEKKP